MNLSFLSDKIQRRFTQKDIMTTFQVTVFFVFLVGNFLLEEKSDILSLYNLGVKWNI